MLSSAISTFFDRVARAIFVLMRQSLIALGGSTAPVSRLPIARNANAIG